MIPGSFTLHRDISPESSGCEPSPRTHRLHAGARTSRVAALPCSPPRSCSARRIRASPTPASGDRDWAPDRMFLKLRAAPTASRPEGRSRPARHPGRGTRHRPAACAPRARPAACRSRSSLRAPAHRRDRRAGARRQARAPPGRGVRGAGVDRRPRRRAQRPGLFWRPAGLPRQHGRPGGLGHPEVGERRAPPRRLHRGRGHQLAARGPARQRVDEPRRDARQRHRRRQQRLCGRHPRLGLP